MARAPVFRPYFRAEARPAQLCAQGRSCEPETRNFQCHRHLRIPARQHPSKHSANPGRSAAVPAAARPNLVRGPAKIEPSPRARACCGWDSRAPTRVCRIFTHPSVSLPHLLPLSSGPPRSLSVTPPDTHRRCSLFCKWLFHRSYSQAWCRGGGCVLESLPHERGVLLEVFKVLCLLIRSVILPHAPEHL